MTTVRSGQANAHERNEARQAVPLDKLTPEQLLLIRTLLAAAKGETLKRDRGLDSPPAPPIVSDGMVNE